MTDPISRARYTSGILPVPGAGGDERSPSPLPPSLTVDRSTVSAATARYLRNVDGSSTNRTGDARADAVDRQLLAASATYVVDGRAVSVAPQFRMSGGFNDARTKDAIAALKDRIGDGGDRIPMNVVGRVLAGRGSPDEIHRVTQALLDAGALPTPRPGESDGERVQRMMWEHGVGIDCAGYVQHALCAVTGLSRERLGLGDPLRENLGSLDRNPHFSRVDLASARPGDVITLKGDVPGEPGHTVLVARHLVCDGQSMSWRFDPRDPATRAIVGAKHLEVFEVDSSWGAGPEGRGGGVQRRMWIHDIDRDVWGTFSKSGYVEADRPYAGHTVAGVFRAKEGA